MSCRANRLWVVLLPALLVSGAVSTGAASSAGTFEIGGAVAHPGAWSAVRIRQDLAADVKTVHYELKGQMHTAQCVPLAALVQAARPRVNGHIKNHLVQFAVIATGRDGYTAVFSLAEMLPQFGHAPVWVALDRDGHSLTADDGPAELLVPNDVKPARWVHALASVTIVDEAQASPHAD